MEDYQYNNNREETITVVHKIYERLYSPELQVKIDRKSISLKELVGLPHEMKIEMVKMGEETLPEIGIEQ